MSVGRIGRGQARAIDKGQRVQLATATGDQQEQNIGQLVQVPHHQVLDVAELGECVGEQLQAETGSVDHQRVLVSLAGVAGAKRVVVLVSGEGRVGKGVRREEAG